MRTQGKTPQLVTFVVTPPFEQWDSLWVINCDCVILEVHGAFSITDDSKAHKIVVEGWHYVARLGKL